jgi:hypothetical protein
MRHRSLLLSLPILLNAACGDSGKPAAPPPRPVGISPETEAEASFRINASIAPDAVPRGGKAALVIEIAVTRPDVHVQKEFPLKVSLTPSAGVALGKASLGHADSVDPEARGRRWEVPVVVNAGGHQEVTAALRFAVCKETEPMWCVTRAERARASVEVR